MTNEEKAEKVIYAISQEGKSLRAACEAINLSPSTFLLWESKSPELAEQYARACEERATYLAEDALKVADDKELDPAHKRIMVDTRKWFASKLNSKRYGDRVDLNHAGSVGVKFTKVVSEIVDPVDDA